MKIFYSSCLDNTVCEYAFKQGFTHVQIDGRTFKIVESVEFGYDWVAE